ncbi:hypothetical protein PENSPDRAFT_664519 [Peniophora sp. CONT]|nr:hypothetical protein PENSPDRAFT_664519 [Peniophora sp. CONT]
MASSSSGEISDQDFATVIEEVGEEVILTYRDHVYGASTLRCIYGMHNWSRWVIKDSFLDWLNRSLQASVAPSLAPLPVLAPTPASPFSNPGHLTVPTQYRPSSAPPIPPTASRSRTLASAPELIRSSSVDTRSSRTLRPTGSVSVGNSRSSSIASSRPPSRAASAFPDSDHDVIDLSADEDVASPPPQLKRPRELTVSPPTQSVAVFPEPEIQIISPPKPAKKKSKKSAVTPSLVTITRKTKVKNLIRLTEPPSCWNIPNPALGEDFAFKRRGRLSCHGRD